jgi:hypothetical protein
VITKERKTSMHIKYSLVGVFVLTFVVIAANCSGDDSLDSSVSDDGQQLVDLLVCEESSEAGSDKTPDSAKPVTSKKVSDLQLALNLVYKVESNNGDPDQLVGDDGKAIGPLQIWPQMIRDVNRIIRDKKLKYPVFVNSDRHSLDKSCQVFTIYQWYYGQQYTRCTGKQPTTEVYSRMWNGGPEGWRRDATLIYWQKIQKIS